MSRTSRMRKTGIACMMAGAMMMMGLFARSARAEDFSAGVVGGLGLTRSLSAEGSNGTSADAGIRRAAAAGFFFRDDMYSGVSGEFRYLYRWGAHEVSNSSASARLAAHSHIFHYDLLFHTSPATSAL